MPRCSWTGGPEAQFLMPASIILGLFSGLTAVTHLTPLNSKLNNLPKTTQPEEGESSVISEQDGGCP